MKVATAESWDDQENDTPLLPTPHPGPSASSCEATHDGPTPRQDASSALPPSSQSQASPSSQDQAQHRANRHRSLRPWRHRKATCQSRRPWRHQKARRHSRRPWRHRMARHHSFSRSPWRHRRAQSRQPSDEPSQIPWAAAQAASQGAVQASTRDAASIAQAPSQGTAASPAPRRQDDHELLICSWNLGVPNLVPENCLNCMSEKAEFSDLVATQIQERVAWNVDVLLLQEVTEFWARHFQTVFSLSTEGDVNLQLHWCEKIAILAKDFWRG